VEHIALQFQDVEEVEAGGYKGRGPSGGRARGVHRVPDRLHLGGQAIGLEHEALWFGHVVGLCRQGQLSQIVQLGKVASLKPQLRQTFAVIRVTLEDQVHGLAESQLPGCLQLRQGGVGGV
jgi:hypothetical protein